MLTALYDNMSEPKPGVNMRVDQLQCNTLVIDNPDASTYNYGSNNMVIPITGVTPQVAFVGYLVKKVLGVPYFPPGALAAGDVLQGGFSGTLNTAVPCNCLIVMRLTGDDATIVDIPFTLQLTNIVGPFSMTFVLNTYNNGPGITTLFAKRDFISGGIVPNYSMTYVSNNDINPDMGYTLSWRASFNSADPGNSLIMTQGWLHKVV